MSLHTAEKQITFRELGLNPVLISALETQGITNPFPIQAASIPDAIAGHDILGRGQTGSGKTLAFGLALLHNLKNTKAKPRQPIALVLAPTRELAQQIDEVLAPLAKKVGHQSVVIAGGLPYAKQVNALKKGVSILVATPGRLIDLLDREELDLGQLEIIVLDEADQMADMGFLPAVKKILNQSKKDGQRFLFSATLDRGVDGLVRQYLREPKVHTIEEIEGTKANSDHYVLVINHSDKSDISSRIAARDGKSIFFVRTKRGADRLATNFSNAGVQVGTLHGGKSQAVRTRTLARFKDQESAVLIATDVAARGIHVDGIDLVVHFDAPADHKDYLHRSGRTARAGKTGRVVTLATHSEQRAISGITRRAGVQPWVMAIKPLDEKLVSITGAKKPSGISLVKEVATKTVEKPYRGARTQSTRGRKRFGSDERRTSGAAPRRKRSR
jgi:superfamily II DNA/RNA helicase